MDALSKSKFILSAAQTFICSIENINPHNKIFFICRFLPFNLILSEAPRPYNKFLLAKEDLFAMEIINLNYVYNQNTVYEKKALDNINLKLDAGKIIGLIGKSGAGKSTLAQNLCGLIKPTSGKILTGNKKIGMVFQFPEHQIFEMTVKKEIEFAIKNKNASEKIILDALYAVGLTDDYLEKNPFELSGGEKRKVAIASILVMQPEILILDEPTVGLDYKTQQNLLSYIKQIHRQKQITIIIISHDVNAIAQLTEKTIIMDAGKIIYYGDTAQAFRNENKNLVRMPDTKKLINLLNENGFQIPDGIIKIDDAAEFIAKRLKEKRN